MSPVMKALSHAASLSNVFSEAALLLLLMSFGLQQKHEFAPDGARSRFLDQATKVAVIVYGIVVVIGVIRLCLTPYT